MNSNREVEFICSRIKDLLERVFEGRTFHVLLYDVPGVMMDGVSIWTEQENGTEIAFNPKFLPHETDLGVVQTSVGSVIECWPQDIPWKKSNQRS
jgi:hypothetical protein